MILTLTPIHLLASKNLLLLFYHFRGLLLLFLLLFYYFRVGEINLSFNVQYWHILLL